MNRLTEYKPRTNSMFPYVLKDDELITKLDSIHTLGRLEDLEEEIGIDLINLFKVLKGNIYSLHPETGKICLIVLPIFYYCGNQWVIGCRSIEWNDKENSCDSWDCLPKDYGKTWALTREELENGKRI